MAKSDLQIEAKHFVKLATAIWKNNREVEQMDLEAQLDLFELYRPADSDRPAASASQEAAAGRDLVVPGKGMVMKRDTFLTVQ